MSRQAGKKKDKIYTLYAHTMTARYTQRQYAVQNFSVIYVVECRVWVV